VLDKWMSCLGLDQARRSAEFFKALTEEDLIAAMREEPVRTQAAITSGEAMGVDDWEWFWQVGNSFASWSDV
jgi:hypothetical protein